MYAKLILTDEITLDFCFLQLPVITSSANICCAFVTMEKAWIQVREYIVTFYIPFGILREVQVNITIYVKLLYW